MLQLKVQHCLSVNTPWQLCTLLQVSFKVNAALKQCTGSSCIEVELIPGPYGADTQNNNVMVKPWAFARFAAWLPKHAGLVNKAMVPKDRCENDRNPDANPIDDPRCQLLELALQQATAALPSPSAAAAAAAAATAAAAETPRQSAWHSLCACS